jgi:hypothetical protein
MLLMDQVKMEPMPVLLASGCEVTDASPLLMSLKRQVIFKAWAPLISANSPIVPPTQSGVIAGGVLTLTFPATIRALSLGIHLDFDGTDQVSEGRVTCSKSFIDSYGVNITQTFNVKPSKRNSSLSFLHAFNNSDYTVPVLNHQGAFINTSLVPVIAPGVTTLTFTGPNGLTIDADLLVLKHPEVVELMQSNLYERLIGKTIDEA